MPFPEARTVGYLLTPPSSPEIPSTDLSDIESLAESHDDGANPRLLSSVQILSRLPGSYGFYEPQDFSSLIWRDAKSSTDSTLSADVSGHPVFNFGANSLVSDPFRRRPALRACKTGSSSGSNGTLRSPDRFLPKRSTLDTFSQRYHANKDVNKLSAAEKLLRHNNTNPDVFSRRRRITSPDPPVASPATRQTLDIVRVGSPSALTFRRDSTSTNGERHVSLGSTWTVGGLAPLSIGVSNGRGGLTGSRTNAPLYHTPFSNTVPKVEDEREKHEGRLAKALEIDRTQRVFDCIDPTTISPSGPNGKRKHVEVKSKTVWDGTEWVTEGSQALLDAPNLRDDFYCSVLAYSPTCHTLAVGLGTMLYAWSEKQGVHLLHPGNANASWLTSIAFSSTEGCKSVLAYGRSDGTVTLMSLYDRPPVPRFELQQPCPIACLKWRPVTDLRESRNVATPGTLTQLEDLVVGDETGNVYYYSVEWPGAFGGDRNGWSGVMTLLACISVHSQQICGLAWSHDGSFLATGGNDNLCCLFRVDQILLPQPDHEESDNETFPGSVDTLMVRGVVTGFHVKAILAGAEQHRWIHGAAVKAIAFCPWREGLLATGGGSNDKCIHFFHAISGACLATISVAAQVTSLIWSTTRREIAATFGYAQPEHPYRIAVFSWPDCTQVAAIPWEGEHRALYAIAYPGGPNESHRSREGGNTMSRTAQEGCIVVAASDESVKFHEVWSAGRKATAGGEGLLGGSDILEGLDGMDKEGEIIR